MDRRPRLTLDRYDVISLVLILGLLFGSLAYLVINPWTLQSITLALAAVSSVLFSIAILAVER